MDGNSECRSPFPTYVSDATIGEAASGIDFSSHVQPPLNTDRRDRELTSKPFPDDSDITTSCIRHHVPRDHYASSAGTLTSD